MLPHALLLLLSAAIARAQSRQALVLNNVASFNASALPSPPSFTLPANTQLTISVAVCSSDTQLPTFFLTNSTNAPSAADPRPGGADVHELSLTDGYASWKGRFANGGLLAVQDNGSNVSFQIAVSDQDAIHQVVAGLPLLGDTTANQAILFSEPFSIQNNSKPTYPNYTLPAPIPQLPTPPPSNNFILIVSPTGSSLSSAPQTGCFLSSQQSAGTIQNESVWLRDSNGWRNQWLIDGLMPSTNYTVYVVENSTKVSGPIYFATKSASFSCTLAYSLPYCPAIAYSIPLPSPPDSSSVYTSANLPDNITTPLLSYLANFTTALTTFACGRDWYSPLVGCDDCQREYRSWLCTISFMRCTEPSPSTTEPSQSQQPLSAHLPIPSTVNTSLVRNPFFPAPQADYTMLLPCLEVCNAMDRACPPFLGIKCPISRFNASASYGVGYIDGVNGQKSAGVTGAAQDRWGNVWCNGF